MAEDIPVRFASITQEQGHGAGPFGTNGMGEGTTLPAAPAIAQAIAAATGAQLTALTMSRTGPHRPGRPLPSHPPVVTVVTGIRRRRSRR
ncbi:hypothetical protein [Actinomadura macra]|uniref:hypothetical protein n=1 Tax=Actinomadura macra TaxID=46164 RepID=UPI000836E1B6|nr:hypothetical protein [Actinomadura macra]